MSDQPRREPPDLSDPRFAVPTSTDLSPWELPSWFTSAAGLLVGMAMVGSGTGAAALGRSPGNPSPVVHRRDISRRRDWIEAVASWALVAAVIAGGRLLAGSWLEVAKVGGLGFVALADVFTVCAVPVLVVRLVRSGHRSEGDRTG